MRRFRYGDPSKSGWKKFAPWAYFILGWNLLGVVLYKTFDRKQTSQDPQWEEKTSKQKYLNMATIGNPAREVVSIKIDGVQDMQTKSSTLADLKKGQQT